MSSPVSHYHHVVCGSPQRLDDTGVAGDHDDAGKDEGDDDLVPGEVDAEEKIGIKSGLVSRSESHPMISSVSLQ